MTQRMPPQPTGPFCQSCSMPMQNPADFGTEADGAQSDEYCTYCYQTGAFTSDLTMEQMVEVAAKGMSEATGTPEAEAHELMRRALPGLKRWSRAA